MVPYQIYEALTDGRERELAAAAERHRRMAEAKYSSRGGSEAPSRLKELTARMVALLHVRREAQSRSTVASTSGAGPIGCST